MNDFLFALLFLYWHRVVALAYLLMFVLVMAVIATVVCVSLRGVELIRFKPQAAKLPGMCLAAVSMMVLLVFGLRVCHRLVSSSM